MTGRPYQSPARGRASPEATPPRSSGRSSSSRESSTSPSMVSSSGAGSGATSIAASPIVFTSRTGGRTASSTCPRSRHHSSELLGRDLLAEAREAHDVDEADHHLLGARQPAALQLGLADDCLADRLAQAQVEHLREGGAGERAELPQRLGVAEPEVALGVARAEQRRAPNVESRRPRRPSPDSSRGSARGSSRRSRPTSSRRPRCGPARPPPRSARVVGVDGGARARAARPEEGEVEAGLRRHVPLAGAAPRRRGRAPSGAAPAGPPRPHGAARRGRSPRIPAFEQLGRASRARSSPAPSSSPSASKSIATRTSSQCGPGTLCRRQGRPIAQKLRGRGAPPIQVQCVAGSRSGASLAGSLAPAR